MRPLRAAARLLVGFVWLGALSPAGAQVQLRGRVVDENAVPVAGSRVTLRPSPGSAEDPRALRAGTDDTGAFQFEVAAGSYLVTAEREGFFILRDRPVDVSGPAAELLLVLNAVRLTSDSINVDSTPPLVTLEDTSVTRQISGRQVLDVPYPASRSLKNALRLMPGAVQDPKGDIHVDGAQENQLHYTLNGFNLGDPVSGRLNARLSVESLRSVEFSSGRYSPEFGKGSAGVLAVKTESGDDRFRASATNFIPGVDTRRGVRIGTWAPRVNFSGPLARGRAWFANHFDGEYNQLVLRDLPRGEDSAKRLQGSNLLHTQYALSGNNNLSVDLLLNFDNAPYWGLGALDPLPTTINRRVRQRFFSIKDQHFTRGGLMLEAGYARNHSMNRHAPQGPEAYRITPFGRTGNHFVDSARIASRDQFLANVFLPEFRWRGAHRVKFGADLNHIEHRQVASRNAFENYGLNGSLLSRTTFAGSGHLRRTNSEVASYLLDTWRIGESFTLDLGVRQDWDALVARSVLSPRIAASLAPFGWTNAKLSAGFAVTRDATNLSFFSRPLDQYALTAPADPATGRLAPPVTTLYSLAPQRLRAPRYHNWTAGYQRQVGARGRLAVQYLRKRGKEGLMFADGLNAPAAPALGPGSDYGAALAGRLYILGNQRRDTYYSLSVSYQQSFGVEYDWMVAYTRSRAITNAVVDLSVDIPLRVWRNFGPQSWDAPHRLVSWGYLPSGLRNWRLAYMLEARSGFPFSLHTEDGQVAGNVNTHRFPVNVVLNLHAERLMKFRQYRFALRAGFNNFTNHRNPTAVNSVIGSPRFLSFYGNEGRHLVFRLRWLGTR